MKLNEIFKEILNDDALINIIGGRKEKLTYGERSEIAISSIGTLGGIAAGSCIAYAWISNTMKRKELNAWGKFWRGAVAMILTTGVVSGTVNETIAKPVKVLVDGSI